MCPSLSCTAPPFARSLKCPFPQPDPTPVCPFVAPTLGREGTGHCLPGTAPIPLLSEAQLSMMEHQGSPWDTLPEPEQSRSAQGDLLQPTLPLPVPQPGGFLSQRASPGLPP